MPDIQIVKIVKILIASPSDVAEERKIAEEVIKKWNIRNKEERQLQLEAVLWESHTATDSGDRTQGIINRQIVDQCDFAIGIFWTRCGTDTGVSPGGAVEEVERMMKNGKKVMLYFSNVPISRKAVDKKQEEQLDKFKESIEKRALVAEYDDRNRFRDSLVDHLDTQVRKWFCPTATASSPEKRHTKQRERYQEMLKEELGYIKMLGMPGVESIKVNLNDDTFVPLRLSDRQENGRGSFPENSSQKNEHILNPDEIMKQAFHDRRGRRMLLVIGDPGAGKTTLLKYYALCAFEEFTRLGFSAPLNVFYLPLRDLLRDKDGHYTDSLPTNLASWSGKHQITIKAEIFEEWLHGGTSLVLLDGLDEISNIAERIKACQWIDYAFTGFSKAFFVVTSRFTGYNKEEGVELESDYERADVQDFTAEQQERFLRNWFAAAFLKEPSEKGVDEALWQAKQKAKAEERTRAIMAHLTVGKNKGLRQLAAIPMILQIMAILWKDRDYMPENRVELYDAALNYLLEFRDKRRGIKPLLSAIDARQVLAPVSLWMQATLEKDEAGKKEMHTAMHEWLDMLDTPPTAEAFCDYLVKRAGLFVESGAKEYLFRHKSFREYLAGVQLKEDRPYDQLGKLVSHFGEEWWEEPLRFFIGSVDGNLFDAFMQKLLDSPKSESLTAKQQLLLQTLIAEAKGKKVDALCKKLLDPANTASRQRVMLDCLNAIGKPAALNALEQFSAKKLAKDKDVTGRTDEVILALGGEVAKGTSRSKLNTHEHNAEYILIPGGSYIYSATKKEESVPDLYVAKYPVTNKLYRSFISALGEASGFREKLNEIATKKTWDTGFSEYLKGGKGDFPTLFRSSFDEDRKFGGDNQPVVGVTWYAAQAYALWLSQLEGKTCRLPTGKEWEWAAAGRQGTTAMEVRKYPWADETREPDSKLLNFDGNVGATTPVGSYPEGATPEGLYDMAGNVWEWTEEWHNVFGSYRVLRGGSWDTYARYCRSASRHGGAPDDRDLNTGFRLAFVP